LPIFDAHMHYSHDAWDVLPADKALALLRQAGVRRALVSSSGEGDDARGQRRLAELAPDLILPSLRPYRQRGDQSTWFRDVSVKAYVDDQLARHRYVALGEYHVFGADADLPVPRHLVAQARGTAWCCIRIRTPTRSSGSSRSGRRRASCGRTRASTHPSGCVRCCASIRRCGATSRSAPTTRRAANWSLSGANSSSTSRSLHGGHRHLHAGALAYVIEHARWARQWLAQLPPAVAERIAYRNGEALFAAVARPRVPQ
jgi:hypothetical protein